MTPSEAIKRTEALLTALHAMPADYYVDAADLDPSIRISPESMDREFGPYKAKRADLFESSFFREVDRDGVRWYAMYPVADYLPVAEAACDIGRQTGDFRDDVGEVVDAECQRTGVRS